MTPSDADTPLTADELARLGELARAATPGPWVRGSWSGRCHIEHKHGDGRCKYDPEFQSWPEDFHHLASPSATVRDVNGYDGEVTGNYDYEAGGIIHEADSDYVAALSPDVVLRLLATLDATRAARQTDEEWRRLVVLAKGYGPGDDDGLDGSRLRVLRDLILEMDARLSSAKDPAPEGEPTVCAVCGISLPDDAAAVEHLGTALANERIRGAHRATR